MTKNIIIGLLVAIVVVGGGYYLLRNAFETPTLPTAQTPSNTQDTLNVPPVVTPPDTTPPITLGAPIVVTNSSSSTSISTALLNGQVTPRGMPTTYWFEYGETSSLGSKTTVQEIGSGLYAIPSPAYVTNLRTNTTYYFRLSAANNFGTSNGVTYNFKTSNNPVPKPAVPTVHTSSATNVLRTSANLNGQVTPNGFQTNYWFEYGKDNKLGATTSIKSLAENMKITSTSLETLSGLEPLTKYYFRLNAQNQFGTVNGSILNFTTQGPANVVAPVTYNVNIVNNAFVPATISIKKGDTIIWTNKDSTSHTLAGGNLNSQPLGLNGTYSYTYNKTGTYDYRCSIHPSMKGTVTVTN